jgi:hypothetical protein
LKIPQHFLVLSTQNFHQKIDGADVSIMIAGIHQMRV